MQLAALWRYPVKSMAGEALDEATLVGGAIAGDRAWAVVVQATGALLSAKRDGRLLTASAHGVAGDDARVIVTLPTGVVGEAGAPDLDRALSSWLGLDVALRRPTPGVASRIDMDVPDLDGDGLLAPTHFTTQPGSFFDSRSPLHAVTTETLAQLVDEHGPGAGEPRRYRPNLIIAGEAEATWIGGQLQVGDVALTVRKATERCVIVTRAQPQLPEDRALLRHLARARAACVGVYLHPVADGVLVVGQPVTYGGA